MRWLPPLSTLAAFPLTLGALACTPSTPDPTDEPTPMTKPAPVTVEAAPSPAAGVDGPEYFFARLSQSGIEHCPGGPMGAGEVSWLDVQPTLGWISTSGVDPTQLEPLLDLPVLARGQAGPAPQRPPLTVEPELCMEMQMRSDWVKTPRGVRSRRTESPAIQHFHATSVRRLDELTLTREGEDAIVVSFENPLPFALDEVALEVHYEGCYGKPGSTSRRSESTSLAPGATLSEQFWLIAEHGQPTPPKAGRRFGVHRAASIVLVIGPQAGPDGATVHADLDVALHDLGVDFDCP